MAKRGGTRRDPAREKFWRRTIRRQQHSGLSVRLHSVGGFRCNGVVRNLPELHVACGVESGEKLWLSPGKRVRIW